MTLYASTRDLKNVDGVLCCTVESSLRSDVVSILSIFHALNRHYPIGVGYLLRFALHDRVDLRVSIGDIK